MAHSFKRQIIFLCGISGAGKKTAMSIFSDLRFYTVDNLPLEMMEQYLSFVPDDAQTVVFGFDSRSIKFDALEILSKAEQLDQTYDVQIVFLKADNLTIHKRYSLSGMTHPLSRNGQLESALKYELELHSPLIEAASMIIDTSDIGPKDLKRRLLDTFIDGKDRQSSLIIITSFGFKYGIPIDAETVFDARILKNPHWHEDLAYQTGLDKAVRAFLADDPHSHIFLEQIQNYITNAILPFMTSERTFYHIAIGCTGGQHRSVYCADKIYAFLYEKEIPCRLVHKQL